MKQFKNIILLMLIFFLAACQNNSTEKSTIPQPKPEAKPKNLTAIYSTFEQLQPRLYTKSDSIYIINFWATWCAPCVAELPHFFEIEKKYKNQKVKLLLVSLDFKSQIKTKLKPFLVDRKITTEVVAITDPNSNEWIDKVSSKWTGSIPATLIFNKDKRGFYEQQFSFEELEKTLKAFIN